jgi:hypothetical protein
MERLYETYLLFCNSDIASCMWRMTLGPYHYRIFQIAVMAQPVRDMQSAIIPDSCSANLRSNGA